MIETHRLRLRKWLLKEARDYKRIASAPQVAAMLGPPPTLARARAVMAGQRAKLAATGHCFWAVERRESPGVIGWCGLQLGPAGTPIAGLPELGWTIDPASHGQGLATEAARAVVAWAWANTAYAQLHAITTPGNAASRAVMARIGMKQVAGGDFEHPALGEGDPLRRHVTYVLARPA